MTDVQAQDRRIAEQLRLRTPPPVAVRLSRRAFVVSGLIGGTAVAAVISWGLLPRPASEPPAAASPPAAQPSEHLAALPADYAAAHATPKLGRPLPGDLGRAMLAPAAAADPAAAGPPTPDRRQEALASGLFAAGEGARGAPRPPPRAAAPEPGPSSGVSKAEHVLAAGTTIRAALITGIRSDLPGPVTAQVTENVHDSVTGRVLLVPQGSRLIGAYDDQVRFGQERLLLTWTRLLLPDGRSIELGDAPATDDSGYAGLSDRVDRKWRQLFGASLVALGLGASAALADQGSDDELLRALRTAGADTAALAGGQVVGKSLDIRPSLTVRPGHPVRVMLTRDLALTPWIAP